jgi:tyrosine-protein kinase Etk/Wzc
MLSFFRILVRWRKFILAATLFTTLIMAAVSLILPKWYTASASIFPPEAKAGVSMYTEMLQNLQVPLLGAVGAGGRPETIYVDMLKSRYIGQKLVEEFDLFRVYGVGLIEDALAELHAHTGFTLFENGLVIVNFEDRDPKRAAAIANRYIQLLDEFNRELNVTRASRTREFVERQLVDRKNLLADAEQALKDFQVKHETLELEEQLRAAMSIVGDLTADAIALETELRILGHYTSPTSDEYLRKKQEYDEVVQQLQKLKVTHGNKDEDLLRAYLPTLADIPELALQLLRLKRAVEIETAVYTMLVKEYEKSRIEEARDTPTLQVMDRAEVPNLRSRPKRKLMVVLGALVGFGWSAFLAVLTTVWRENRERSKVITEVIDPIVGDFARVFRRRR